MLHLTGSFVQDKILSRSPQKFANVSGNRLLTRAALIGAATVRERSLRDTRVYLRNGVLSYLSKQAKYDAGCRTCQADSREILLTACSLSATFAPGCCFCNICHEKRRTSQSEPAGTRNHGHSLPPGARHCRGDPSGNGRSAHLFGCAREAPCARREGPHT